MSHRTLWGVCWAALALLGICNPFFAAVAVAPWMAVLRLR